MIGNASPFPSQVRQGAYVASFVSVLREQELSRVGPGVRNSEHPMEMDLSEKEEEEQMISGNSREQSS